LEKNHRGELLMLPGLKGLRQKKEGQLKSLPLFEVSSRRIVRKVCAGKIPAILGGVPPSTVRGYLFSCS
jgi:hypothetical protein